AHRDIMESATRRNPDQFSFKVCDGANLGASHQVEERPVDKAHHDSGVDAAHVGHYPGGYGCRVLDVAAEKHLDVKRRRHEHHLNIHAFLLKKSLFFGDGHGHHRHGKRRNADFDVL